MAPMKLSDSAAALKAATYRLSSTPSKQLTHIAPQIAAQLWNCKDLLSSTADTAKQTNDAAAVVHRFKTHLSSLLQDRTVEGRWSAVVLVKATIEAGGVEALSKSNAWVRNLLGILKKPDPPTTRNLVIITLTRIFMLTWEYPSLVREITTPALPTFVATCMSNVENKRCSASELLTVLEAFVTLLPRHPTIFRTNESQIRSLLVKILSASSSSLPGDFHYTKNHQAVARRLFAMLHYCTPKQGSADKWDQTFKATVAAAHATCDRLFRSVIEDWKSVAGVRPSALPNALLQGGSELESDNALGLDGWQGVYAGSERLVSLFDLLKSQIETGTAGAVTVRIGAATDLLTRALSLRVPHGKHNGAKPNIQVDQTEREAMFSAMPSVHVAALQLTDALLNRFGKATASIVLPLLAQITWVFAGERSDSKVRAAIYTVMTSILQSNGPSLAMEDVADIDGILRACCQDLLPIDDFTASSQAHAQGNGVSVPQPGASSDLGLQASKSAASLPTIFNDLHVAAEALLPVCISRLSTANVPGRLRALMERTAVLTQHKDALVACVLNPASKGKASSAQTSLLPLLAKLYPHAPEVEALLRPRMPYIRTGNAETREDNVNEDDEDDYDDQDMHGYVNGDAINGAQEDGEPTDGLLNALGQQDATAESEDLYSASPLRQPVHVDNQQGGAKEADATSTLREPAAEKRRADAAPSSERSAKRLQASPVAEALLPAAASSLPGPDSVGARNHESTTVVYDQPQSSYATAPEPSQHLATLSTFVTDTSATGPYGAAGDEDNDNSDFELPPLTMDASDDDEDEDEDEDGEAEAAYSV